MMTMNYNVMRIFLIESIPLGNKMDSGSSPE